jgi:hypothetical protein
MQRDVDVREIARSLQADYVLGDPLRGAKPQGMAGDVS